MNKTIRNVAVMAALWIMSYLVYAKIWNSAYSLLIVVSLFIHEMGHVWALWHYGRKVKGMYAIPLLGAAVVSNDPLPNRIAQFAVFLMGPAWGFAGAAIAFIAYKLTGQVWLAGASAWMLFPNLFNMYPASMLDGGQAWKVIISPFPKWVQPILIALPVAALGYFAFILSNWVFWAFFGVVVVASFLELMLKIWRGHDRSRVLSALSAFLEVPTDGIISRINTLLEEIETDTTCCELHPLFLDTHFSRKMRKYVKSEDIPKLSYEQIFRRCLTQVARDARFVIRVRSKQLDVTSDKSLIAESDPGDHGKDKIEKSPLGVYLAVDPLSAPIPKVQAVTLFVAYFLLTFSMVCFMSVVLHVPGAVDALFDIMKK